jgi:glycerol-1-phosphate dehydrogenase [NAD(P)+]
MVSRLRAHVAIPSFVRIKPCAHDRLGLYLARQQHGRVALLTSDGLPRTIVDPVSESLARHGITIVTRGTVGAASVEQATDLLGLLRDPTDAIVGLGGGKALDVAKYVAFLARLPYYAVPTSLSNDGFCSPRSSLTEAGRRGSQAAALPFGVVIDVDVCLEAPDVLWWSGVGDLVAKVTATADWKLAFHAVGTPVDDLAALLSDATVSQFMARPIRDRDGMRSLGTALMLNGIAMEICGSSRPASGSEHLVSHALDVVSARSRLHGLQVGVATYLVSHLQRMGTDRVARLLDATGFWRGIEADPFSRREWLEAVRLAPGMKEDYYTVLSSRDCVPEVAALLEEDARLARCFRD